jgi:hypothetical protein
VNGTFKNMNKPPKNGLITPKRLAVSPMMEGINRLIGLRSQISVHTVFTLRAVLTV